MGHSVHPYAHRIAIIRDWKSRWFNVGENYRKNLRDDILLREFLAEQLRGLYVSTVEIERGQGVLRLIIKTARPGFLIGRSGEGTVKLKEGIFNFIKRNGISRPESFKMDIEEVRSPESDAAVVAQMVSDGLERRLPFRRVLKQTIEKVYANRDVKGVRIKLSGRLGGADMAREEDLRKGRIPLQTFRADIDFAKARAKIPQGAIGIKVWIYRGEVFN